MVKKVSFPYKIENGAARPKIPVIFYNKDDLTVYKKFICLVDSGADNCVLLIDWKDQLKIKDVDEKGTINCACGETLPAPKGEVLFEIEHDAFKGLSFETKVSFVNPYDNAYRTGRMNKPAEKTIDVPPLLGRDAFKYFDITFLGKKKEVIFKLKD